MTGPVGVRLWSQASSELPLYVLSCSLILALQDAEQLSDSCLSFFCYLNVSMHRETSLHIPL